MQLEMYGTKCTWILENLPWITCCRLYTLQHWYTANYMTGSYGRVVWLARPSHANAQLQASGHLQDSLASQTNGRVDYDTVIHYNLYLIITYAACTWLWVHVLLSSMAPKRHPWLTFFHVIYRQLAQILYVGILAHAYGGPIATYTKAIVVALQYKHCIIMGLNYILV